MTLSRAELARYIDHTLLAPEATDADVAQLAAEAASLGTYSICVSPSRVPLAPGVLGAAQKLAVVCGFPSGAHPSAAKAADAHYAVQSGADEIDMVIDLGAATMGNWKAVESDIAVVRTAIGGQALLKVIIESALLGDDGIVAACRAAEAAGADFVKTSTGFHPAGGASVHAVELMRKTVGDRLGVKASGGIRTTEAALAMIEAGATRLGLSASRAILDFPDVEVADPPVAG